MNESILMKITQQRRTDIDAMKLEQPLTSFEKSLQKSERDFYQAIEEKRDAHSPAFILECKKASPSKGLIKADFNLPKIVESYAPFATAISVLTEKAHFGGDFKNLAIAKKNAACPILCKDFVVDAYQIYLARFYGADAILLMLSVLKDDEYRYLTNIAHELGMGVLTEVNDEEEVSRALRLQAKVIGINNRDLRDLSIDLTKTERLRALMPVDQLVISESGIRDNGTIRHLSSIVDGFLIGSHLMGSDNLDRALRELLIGGHKVCGLKTIADAQAAQKAGAMYGGLIFILSSPRGVTYKEAEQITQAVPLNYIGVFQNDDIDTIAFITEKVGLSAVQLHGQEPQEYITQLRHHLPHDVQIIKAINIDDSMQTLPNMDYDNVDYYLLDGKKGGSGEPFDWRLLQGKDLSRVILAGGLNIDNIIEALQLKPYAVDINSGVERVPGEKCPIKLEAMFNKIEQHRLTL